MAVVGKEAQGADPAEIIKPADGCSELPQTRPVDRATGLPGRVFHFSRPSQVNNWPHVRPGRMIMSTNHVCPVCLRRRATIKLLFAWAAVLAGVAGVLSPLAAILA